MNLLTIGERIKKMRKALDLTQQEFADRLGMKQNTIATYEMNRTNPSDPAIKSICREFNINEAWLRNGEGEMFVQQSNEDELADMVERLITGESAEFKRRLVRALSSLKEEHWILVEQKLKEIVGMRDAAPAFAPAPTASTELTAEQEVELEVERYRQQLLTEKRQASQTSSVKESGLA